MFIYGIMITKSFITYWHRTPPFRPGKLLRFDAATLHLEKSVKTCHDEVKTMDSDQTHLIMACGISWIGKLSIRTLDEGEKRK